MLSGNGHWRMYLTFSSATQRAVCDDPRSLRAFRPHQKKNSINCNSHSSQFFSTDSQHSRIYWTQMWLLNTFFLRFKRLSLLCPARQFLSMNVVPLGKLLSLSERHNVNRRLLKFVNRRKLSYKSLTVTSVQFLIKLSVQ